MMKNGLIKDFTPNQQNKTIDLLKSRFEKNLHRHKEIEWEKVRLKFEDVCNLSKLHAIYQMEQTGGEPDVVGYDNDTGEYIIFDCSTESPKDRRSLCYDREALESRQKHKPKNSALDMAASMGIELLNEDQYRKLQEMGDFDTKTSSWIKTPGEIRKLGGALFADFRYGLVFVYHNSAPSYYASRGFRGVLKI